MAQAGEALHNNGLDAAVTDTGAGRAALVAFLGALTDSTFLTSPRFPNPFARGSFAPDSGVTVTIQGNQFLPSSVVVRPGAVVSFHNIDNEWHNATFDSPAVGATPKFTSGVQTIVMPTALGAYTYHCTVHGPAMSGSVVVGR